MFKVEEKDPLLAVYGADYFHEQWRCKFNLVVSELHRRKHKFKDPYNVKFLEIGVRLGYGAEAIIEAASSAFYDLSFFGLDAYCDDGPPPYCSLEWFKESAVSRILNTGKVGRIEFDSRNSRDVSKLISADIYHIDAGHSYSNCLQDIILVCGSAPKGAMVIVDDALSDKEVHQACVAVTRPTIERFSIKSQDGKFFFGGNGNFVFYLDCCF